MKKTTLLILFLIIATALIYYFFAPRFFSNRTSLHNDTILVRQYCESAKKLRYSNPDSAVVQYQKAIQLLEKRLGDDKINDMLATVYLDLSCLHFSNNDYERQKEYLRKGLLLDCQGNEELNAYKYYCQGLVQSVEQKSDSALFFYNKAENLARQTGAKALEAKVLSNSGIIYFLQGNTEKAIANFSRTEEIGIELNDVDLISGSYINRGLMLTHTNDYEKAKDIYAKAIEYYSKNNLDDDLSTCFLNMGNIYYWQENYAEALAYYQQSLALNIKTGNKQEIAKSYNNIGEIYRIIGDQDQALNMYFESLKIKEEISDIKGTAVTRRALASIYFNQKNYSKALEYYQIALKTDSTLNLVENMAYGYANMAVLYNEYKKGKEAIDYALKAIELFKQTGNAWGESDVYQSLGSIYLDQKEYDLALAHFRKSLAKMMTFPSDREGIATVYLALSMFYTKKPGANLQDLDQAEQYGLSAYHIADSLKLPLLISKTSETLAWVYERKQNMRQAVRFLKINKEANDSIFSQSKAESLVFAEARWNDEKRQAEIRHLEDENQLILKQKEEEHKRHRIILYGLIIIFVLIALAAVLFWKYKHEQREMRQQQQLARITMLRMENIRNRISPHFIFNILNHIISRIKIDDKSYQELFNLIKLMRLNLTMTEKLIISLEEELDFVETYVLSRRQESGKGIAFTVETESGIDIANVEVPSMIIQIPIENSIKHAFRQERDNQYIKVLISKTDTGTTIRIEDNGSGFYPQPANRDMQSTGTGLKVLTQTIELLNSYNENKIIFSIDNKSENSGCIVTYIFPDEYNYTLD